MAELKNTNDGRGRDAERPWEIPRPGWRDILIRTKDQIESDHVSLVAASIAFYGLLALFPAIGALVAFGGLVLEPQQIEQEMETVSDMIPPEAASIIMSQARQVASNAGGGIAFAAIVGLFITLFSASRGMKALIEGLNIIYHEDEKRGFIKLNLTALGLMFALIVVMILAIGVIAIVPALFAIVGLGSQVELVVSLARWPLLFVVAMIGLSIIYRYGPSRHQAQWKWLSWGAAIGTLFWVIGSFGFSIYVSNFGSYNETYGSLGAVIILLLWFWLSAFIVLLGAELNSQMEHQTSRDSTLGEPKPMGKRGAYVADTLGKIP